MKRLKLPRGQKLRGPGPGTEFFAPGNGLDGLGRARRNGLNFIEGGFGLRGARGRSDRSHTAVSQLPPESVYWE